MWKLVAEGVGHSFGSTEVLAKADLTVKQGESVAIMSPSGSGKTTFLAILGGLISPSEGRVSVVDECTDREVRPNQLCSWVFQTTNSFGRRSVLDNVAASALARGTSLSEANRRANELLDRMGLSDRRQLPARLLSGGELQRMSIARALSAQQPFLLADEPTGQLDQANSDAVVEALFGNISDYACGLVVVSHDAEVARHCQRVFTIGDGILTEDSVPRSDVGIT